jgi:uncharacterized protein
MAMTADELSAPLGRNRKPAPQGALRLSVYQAAVITLALFAAGFLAWAMLGDRSFGSGPAALAPADVAATSTGKKPAQTAAGVPESVRDGLLDSRDMPPAEPVTLPAAATRTITIIDGTSGKRQEIAIPAWTNPPTGDAPPMESPRRAVDRPMSRAANKSAPAQ